MTALLSLLKVSGDVVMLNLLISLQKLGELGVSKNFVFHGETFHSVINRWRHEAPRRQTACLKLPSTTATARALLLHLPSSSL